MKVVKRVNSNNSHHKEKRSINVLEWGRGGGGGECSLCHFF